MSTHGVIVEMTRRGPRHAATVQRLTQRLTLAVGSQAGVRIQLPFAASDLSEPEPDVAVVPNGDYDQAHPQTVMLLIEVSESSLTKDRRFKSRIYAAAGAPEYWVIDVLAGTIEVRTQPVDGEYAHLRVVRAGERIRLRALPDVEIAVGDVVR